MGARVEIRNMYNILVGNTEGKRPLGGRSRRWEDDFKVDLRFICGTVSVE
jgi:hypothetical protein